MLNENPSAIFARKAFVPGPGLVRLRAIGVVGGNVPRRTAAARIPKIAGEDDGTILRQMDKQRRVPWRMTGRSEDYDRTIAKHIVVRCERAHLGVLKRIVIFELLALPRLLPEHEVPLGFIDDPGRAFEEVCVPRMIEIRSEEHTSEL